MSDFTSVKCDICGKIKDQSNNWLKATLLNMPPVNINTKMLPSIEDANDELSALIITRNTRNGQLDVCSPGCMQILTAAVVKVIMLDQKECEYYEHNRNLG